MTVQTLKVGRERFVLLKEKDYQQLKARAKAQPARKGRKPTFQERQDAGDVAEAKRRAHEPALPYSELRKELGLV